MIDSECMAYLERANKALETNDKIELDDLVKVLSKYPDYILKAEDYQLAVDYFDCFARISKLYNDKKSQVEFLLFERTALKHLYKNSNDNYAEFLLECYESILPICDDKKMAKNVCSEMICYLEELLFKYGKMYEPSLIYAYYNSYTHFYADNKKDLTDIVMAYNMAINYPNDEICQRIIKEAKRISKLKFTLFKKFNKPYLIEYQHNYAKSVWQKRLEEL